MSSFDVSKKAKSVYGDNDEDSHVWVVLESLFDDDKLCVLVKQEHKKERKVKIVDDRLFTEYKYSLKFLVFTPYGKVDEKSTNKLNRMVEKLNNDIINNEQIYEQLSRLGLDRMIINNKNNTIDLFSVYLGGFSNLRIFQDGTYSITEKAFEFEVNQRPIVDPQGNIIAFIHEKQTNEIMIKIFIHDREYKHIDEIKIKIEKTMTRHILPVIAAVTVDARGHFFIAFPIKESPLPASEWQIATWEDANLVVKYPGYIVYEFDPSGQLIGPRAILQTIQDLKHHASEDYDINKTRFILDNQWNLYYLYYQPDSTQIWMVPSSRNAK